MRQEIPEADDRRLLADYAQVIRPLPTDAGQGLPDAFKFALDRGRQHLIGTLFLETSAGGKAQDRPGRLARIVVML
jgi:hypothetical protein